MKFQKEEPLEEGVFYMVQVFATGVKKKCRKVQRHMLPMGYTSYKQNLSESDREGLKKAAKLTIGAAMRSIYDDNRNCYISLIRVTRTKVFYKNEPAYFSESWEPFHELNQGFKI